MAFEGAEFHVVQVDLREAQVGAVWRGEDGKPLMTFANALEHCRSKSLEPLFMTNAGIFTPGIAPGGLYVESGAVRVPVNRNEGKGNFHLKPNGVFFLDTEGAHVQDTELVHEDAVRKMLVATQSGPLLVGDGKLHPGFRRESENKKVRSGVGVRTPLDVCFVLSEGEVNFHLFARLFLESLQCQNALYLDGVISQFYMPGKPEFQPGLEQFAAMLVVTAK